jgi:hypothetical protein
VWFSKKKWTEWFPVLWHQKRMPCRGH